VRFRGFDAEQEFRGGQQAGQRKLQSLPEIAVARSTLKGSANTYLTLFVGERATKQPLAMVRDKSLGALALLIRRPDLGTRRQRIVTGGVQHLSGDTAGQT